MTKFEEEFNYLIELSGKVLIGQVDAESFEKNRVSFFEKYETDQQQALPVVPEFVAGAIESIPDHCSAFEAIGLIKSKVETLPEENKDWLPVFNWLCDDIKNQDIFALAFITGKYEVEKPQLFYLKNKLTGDCLARCLTRDSVGLYVEVTEKWLARKEQTSYQLSFTKQDIDSMEAESYEQIEVTE